MISDMKNRTFESDRKPGRPPASVPKQPVQEAVIDPTQRKVPPLVCPKCGRGMTPRVAGWHGGTASCICSLTGCRFTYTPATVRCT